MNWVQSAWQGWTDHYNKLIQGPHGNTDLLHWVGINAVRVILADLVLLMVLVTIKAFWPNHVFFDEISYAHATAWVTGGIASIVTAVSASFRFRGEPSDANVRIDNDAGVSAFPAIADEKSGPISAVWDTVKGIVK